MSAHYPLPCAEKEGVDKLVAVYKEKYNVELSFDQAKQFLEQLMQFVYLTQIDSIVNQIVGHYNDPFIAQQVMKELRRKGQWGRKTDEENTGRCKLSA